MTTVQMIEWFDILQDKFGSPYFTEDEKLLFLNRGSLEYVKATFPDNEGGILNLESDWNVLQNVAPLVFELSETSMDAVGKLTLATITTSLRTISGDATCDIFKVLAVEFKRGIDRFPCKFLRHNDKAEFERNYFKKPDFDNPRVLFQNANLQFRPIDTLVKVYITALKTPKVLTLVVNSDLPISTHNEIVAYALQFAGVASRDEILAQMNMMQLPK